MGVGGQRHAPAALPLGKRTGIHCTGGWVGPSVGVQGCRKSRLHCNSIPGPSNVIKRGDLHYSGTLRGVV